MMNSNSNNTGSSLVIGVFLLLLVANPCGADAIVKPRKSAYNNYKDGNEACTTDGGVEKMYEMCAFGGYPSGSSYYDDETYCYCSRNVEYNDCRFFNLTSTTCPECEGMYFLADGGRAQDANNFYYFQRQGQPFEEDRIFAYYTNGKWQISKTLLANGDISCAQSLIGYCHEDAFKVTQCDRLYRTNDDHCGTDYPANNEFQQPSFCRYYSKPCCSTGVCKETDCDTDKYSVSPTFLKDDCSLDEIIRPVDKCDITPMDNATWAMTASNMLDIAGLLASQIPVAGELFDDFFSFLSALADPFGSAALYDDVASAVNAQIAALQECMYQSLTQVSVDMVERDYKIIIQTMDNCYNYTGEMKSDCILDVFSKDLQPRIMTDFVDLGGGDDVFLQYEAMLPVYQLAKQLLYTSLSGALQVLQVQNDGCNYNAVLGQGKDALNKLKDWSTFAWNSIRAELRPPILDVSDKGGIDRYMKGYDGYDWFKWSKVSESLAWIKIHKGYRKKNDKNCLQFGVYHRLETRIRMTKYSDRYCSVWSKGKWACYEQWGDFGTHMQVNVDYVTQSIPKRVDGDLKKAYNNKFVNDLVEYQASLDKVTQMSCSSKTEM